jgi:Ran GTPase-activating protein (RanGAP) involved in mRNA processing and transport
MNNLLSDLMSGVILLAIFMNPTIMKFVYVGNSARNVFKNTFCALANKNPDKLKEINFMKSIPQIETLYQFTRNLTTYQDLIKVNLAGNAFSLNACRTFSMWLLKQNTLKDMNLASCKISN